MLKSGRTGDIHYNRVVLWFNDGGGAAFGYKHGSRACKSSLERFAKLTMVHGHNLGKATR
jgi:hypothetical protein